jgi:integrase
MATLKPYLDTRSKKKDNTYPVKIAIRHKNETIFLSTEISITTEQWKENKVTDHPKAIIYNKAIRFKFMHAENIILLQSSSGNLHKLSVKDLKVLIEGNNEEIKVIESIPEAYSIESHFEKYILQCRKPKTAQLYRETLNKIKSFRPDSSFNDVNISWLKSFDIFLSATCKTNTRAIHMRNIRAVFNDAINEELISQNNYPFRKFEIKKEKTFKRFLTIEQLKLLRDYPVQPHQERYRDIFMLNFYLIGINMIDLLHLKTIINGRIEYTREKTYRLYSIEVLPEAQAIIDKYKGINYLLNIMDSYTNYKDFDARMNENLKEIGKLEWITNNAKDKKFKKKNKKKITPLFPKLSTYWARHTWATIASKLDIPKETIAAALGHGGNDTTDIYINFDLAKIDEANKKVIEAII